MFQPVKLVENTKTVPDKHYVEVSMNLPVQTMVEYIEVKFHNIDLLSKYLKLSAVTKMPVVQKNMIDRVDRIG